LQLDPKNPVWWALGIAVVVGAFLVHWLTTTDDSRRQDHVVFGDGVIDCDTVRSDPDRIELRAWLAGGEDRAVNPLSHEGSVQAVEEIYAKGAREVLVGAFEATEEDAGPRNVRRYVIVPPGDPQARRDFLDAWGGASALAEHQHDRCMVVGGS
jgi:hypothetical protein